MDDLSFLQEVGANIAYRIRAELVCCHIYEELAPLRESLSDAAFADILEDKGHDLCYWGEAAAQLAETHDQDMDTSAEGLLFRRVSAGIVRGMAMARLIDPDDGTVPMFVSKDGMNDHMVWVKASQAIHTLTHAVVSALTAPDS
jgi:hypothetical protein